MDGIIYKITNRVNNKIYIGQTIQTLKARWQAHCRLNCIDMVIKKAINKYGKENFLIEEIERCPKEKLDEREIYWISYYDSYHNGYNSTKGGKLAGGHIKIKEEFHQPIVDLYLEGKSLRFIAKNFQIDKATVKHYLQINNVKLRTKRIYKFKTSDLNLILQEINSGVSRNEIMIKYNISASYLSQLINGKRRI